MEYKNKCQHCTFSLSFKVDEDDPKAGVDNDLFNYLKGIIDNLVIEHTKQSHPQT